MEFRVHSSSGIVPIFFFAHEETDTQNLKDLLKVKEVVSIVSMGQLSRKL